MRLLKTAGALAAGPVAVNYWINQQTKNLPKEQKGDLLPRIKNVVDAWGRLENTEDKYTKKHHLKLIASLPSESSFVVQQSHFSPLKHPRYGNWSVVIPDQATQGDNLIAGTSLSVPDIETMEAIRFVNYQRCQSKLGMSDFLAVYSGERQYFKFDHRCNCELRRSEFLTDLMHKAIERKLDPKHPYADTLVLQCTEKGCERVGDLTTMSPQIEEQIRKGNFSIVNSYAKEKTRLSGDKYKEVAAILVGEEDHRKINKKEMKGK